MKLGSITKHPHSDVFLVLGHDQDGHANPNSKLLSTTNIDVSKLEKRTYSDLNTLGEALCDITLEKALELLSDQNPNDGSLESFKDKFVMCHRGLVPVYLYVNDSNIVSVLSFSDESPEEFHITRFLKAGVAFQHSFDMQGKSIHYAYPEFFSGI